MDPLLARNLFLLLQWTLAYGCLIMLNKTCVAFWQPAWSAYYDYSLTVMELATFCSNWQDNFTSAVLGTWYLVGILANTPMWSHSVRVNVKCRIAYKGTSFQCHTLIYNGINLLYWGTTDNPLEKHLDSSIRYGWKQYAIIFSRERLRHSVAVLGSHFKYDCV